MKNVILILLSLPISFICADDNIRCSSDFHSNFNVCCKNGELIYVNQTKHTDKLFIAMAGIDSIAPNTFQDLPVKNLELIIPKTIWAVADEPLRIQTTSFEGLRQVKNLLIAKGNLQLEHNIFAALESLEYLSMEFCTLTLANGSFTGLPRIKTLSITFSKSFEMLPGVFTGLDELKDLFLFRNNITTIQKNIFNHMNHLDLLDLSGNGIRSIEAGAFNGTSVKILDLKFNRLTVIPTGTFTGVSVDYLKLYNNRIFQIEANAFGNSTVKELQYTKRFIIIDKQLVGLGELTVLNGDFD